MDQNWPMTKKFTQYHHLVQFCRKPFNLIMSVIQLFDLKCTIEFDSNIVKSSAHWSLQRQSQTHKDKLTKLAETILAEQTHLKKSLSLFNLSSKLIWSLSIVFAITSWFSHMSKINMNIWAPVNEEKISQWLES